jgi:preprotein translocase subunit SecY
MVGILARLPQAFFKSLQQEVTNNGGPMLLVIEIIIWLLVIICCVLLVCDQEFLFNMSLHNVR